MDATVLTPRLKLTLMETAERGSPELEWLHEMRSDKLCTFWSLSGQSKSIEDTEKFAKLCLPQFKNKDSDDANSTPKLYRIAYAVHELLPTTTNEATSTTNGNQSYRFIGQVTIRCLNGPSELVLPSEYVDASTQNSNTLCTELGYQFLPRAWGKGYATEAVDMVCDAVGRAAPTLWAPYEKVYVRSLVNEKNPPSQKVMHKLKMDYLGTWEWTGPKLYLGGEWIDRSRICIFGKYLVG